MLTTPQRHEFGFGFGIRVAEECCPFNLALKPTFRERSLHQSSRWPCFFATVRQSGNVLDLHGFTATIIKLPEYPYFPLLTICITWLLSILVSSSHVTIYLLISLPPLHLLLSSRCSIIAQTNRQVLLCIIRSLTLCSKRTSVSTSWSRQILSDLQWYPFLCLYPTSCGFPER